MNFKKIGLLAAALGLVLAVAAFGSNGLRELLSTQIKSAQAGDAPAPETLNLVVSTNGINDASGMVSVINFVPAAELPARAPDAAGLYGGFDGSTLTLQQSFFLAAPNGEGAVMGGTGIVSGAVPVGAAPVGAVPSGAVQSGAVIVSGQAFSGTIEDLGALPLPTELGALEHSFSLSVVAPDGQPLTGTLQALPAEAGTIIVSGPGMPVEATPRSVLVTSETKIYRDVTPMNIAPAEGVQSVQQVLEAGSLDDLGENVIVTVWGHMENDQLVADVILYQTPFEITTK